MLNRVRDGVRHAASVERARHALRAKTMRAVAEVTEPLHRELLAEVSALRAEVDRLHETVRELHERTRSEADRGIEFARKVEIRARRDIIAAGERQASLESAQLVEQAMTDAKPCLDPHETLRHALSLAPSGGLALEFGVYTGTTLRIISEVRADQAVYGFDSFKGLPENWRSGFPAGIFDTDGLPEVPGAQLVVGWFDEVLPGFLSEHEGVVDFLHVDCDLYASTKTVLDAVGPRLRQGSIVLFDEYFNYPGWQRHEYLAWQEYTQRTGMRFNYETYTLDNEQVAIRITGA